MDPHAAVDTAERPREEIPQLKLRQSGWPAACAATTRPPRGLSQRLSGTGNCSGGSPPTGGASRRQSGFFWRGAAETRRPRRQTATTQFRRAPKPNSGESCLAGSTPPPGPQRRRWAWRRAAHGARWRLDQIQTGHTPPAAALGRVPRPAARQRAIFRGVRATLRPPAPAVGGRGRGANRLGRTRARPRLVAVGAAAVARAPLCSAARATATCGARPRGAFCGRLPLSAAPGGQQRGRPCWRALARTRAVASRCALGREGVGAEGPRAGRGPPPPRQPRGPFAAASGVSAALCGLSAGWRADEGARWTGSEGVDAGFRHEGPEPRA